MLAISSLAGKYIRNKDKEKCQNIHHDQSAVSMPERYKIDDIQQSNIVKLDGSGCSNDNNMAITNGQTLGDNNKDLEMKNDKYV